MSRQCMIRINSISKLHVIVTQHHYLYPSISHSVLGQSGGMAMRWLSLLLLLTLCAFMSISATMAEKDDDEAALLAFKAAAISGGYDDPLASWNSSTSGYCRWEGVRCQGRHQRVVALSLPSRGLIGILSPSVGNLSSLRTLNLSFNGFSGDIPASLGSLRRLHNLDLSHNAFSGEFPMNLTSCINLKIMALRGNQLHGRVPSEIGDKLMGLRALGLAKNSLTGTIPASIGNLSSLTKLALEFNQLEGTIPPSLGDILGLRFLSLAFNNLSGEPPLSLYNLSSLQLFQLQANMLEGSIPTDIGVRFPSIQFLFFYQNHFTGSIPNSISNLTTLKSLQLGTSRLSGYVPPTLGRLHALQSLGLEDTMLVADGRRGWEFITSLSNCSQLFGLDLFGNTAFTGQLPISIGNLSTTLRELRFSDTSISGSIPTVISNLLDLQIIDASNTSISGVIPRNIGKLRNLVELNFSQTQLSGLIPSSIVNLSMLSILDAHHAKLEGAIPTSLGKLTNLAAIDLSWNYLNGSIPIEIFNLTLLSRFLDLSYNSLSGFLPSEVGSLRNLNSMVLSGNQLSGEIPESIGECTVLQQLLLDNNSFKGNIPQSLWNIKGLSVLNLSMNKLSGIIPNRIGSITNLQELYLAHNNLSGPILTTLENMTSLSKLDLSFNNLQGEVPKEGIFKNMSKFSITGNRDLCGGISQLHLAQCHKNTLKKNRTRRLKSLIRALAISGAILFLGIVITIFQLVDNKFRRRQNSPFLPPIIEEQYERVSYRALENGTNGFSEANLLGQGSFGAVYRCTFQDEGAILAVKVFNVKRSGSTRSFVAECEALKRVRHRSLIKIITCCSSINHQGEEFRALIFEFMPNGSLNDWLHSECNMGTLRNTLSLAQRLNMAVDIMEALDYLHNQCQPSIVHCDLKPSNILLAQDMSARVGDFGISKMLPECVTETLQNTNSTIGIRGSIGYVAPEYAEGSSVSTLGDVYSLGILLLEMFTGRSPTDDMFRGPLDLHKFAEDALPNRIWEIVDSTMWLHASAGDNTIRSKTENCLLSVIALGISCSKTQPRERTLIQDAATEMHAIRDSYLILVRSAAVSK